ncbi:class III lanthionine synthetase LanKC [Alkalimonas amylolytica]|uniref:Lanthionine synthetase C-like protein n=1 Tax=Alkalimonas amylolytica TaxID=152573 RepID=A0A1H3Y8I3_ALKAM|nr:class III lanthionine synthetase LanKC [Alkalimonas amylolytica]SEA07935.1 Lanthionine synthetase C-like protein [Alkalimonas amylolytica]
MQDLNAHQDFYIPYEWRKPGKIYRDAVASLLPPTWRLQQDYFWIYARPPSPSEIVQGWKIHLSATQESAVRILGKVVPVLLAAEVEFKFASDDGILKKLLSKNCSRASSGKFITVYPRDKDQFEQLIQTLAMAVDGEPGPYIFSDTQYKDSSIVFYRYGGFQSLSEKRSRKGRVAQILDDNYHFVEDQRVPHYWRPEFITEVFPQLHEQIQFEEDDELFGGDFVMEGAIKFSNAGGVYQADYPKAKCKALIKEARPYVGHGQNTDCISLLQKEYRLLDKISSLNIAPKPLKLFSEWQHTFLAQEFLSGETLRVYQVRQNKLIHTGSSREEMQAWLEELILLAKQLLNMVEQLHESNILFGDLSLNNIMIDLDTKQLKLIDFEAAFEPGVDASINICTPGYARWERTGADEVSWQDDYYALGCVLLAMLVPNTTLINLRPEYPRVFLQELQQDIGLPQAYMDCTLQLLSGELTSLKPCIELLQYALRFQAKTVSTMKVSASARQNVTQSIADILRYHSTLLDCTKTKRLLPLGAGLDYPLALDYGIAGVAYGWQLMHGSIPAELKRWIEQQVRFQNGQAPVGLMDGLAGAVWALSELGMHEQALQLLPLVKHHRYLFQSMSLGYGVAGIGQAALKLWLQTAEPGCLELAQQMAEALCYTAQHSEHGCYWGQAEDLGHDIGFLEGSSGVALFLLCMYCETEKAEYLAVGESALQFDIAHGRETKGSYGFPRHSEDNILYPYFAYGSAGVASVAMRYYLVTSNPDYLEVVTKTKASVAQKYAITSGLMIGLAGIGHFLLDAHFFLNDDHSLQLAWHVADGLKLFALPKSEGLAFPDDNRTKVSCDFAAGSTGVGLFLHRLVYGGCNPLGMLDQVIQARLSLQLAEKQIAASRQPSTV